MAGFSLNRSAQTQDAPGMRWWMILFRSAFDSLSPRQSHAWNAAGPRPPPARRQATTFMPQAGPEIGGPSKDLGWAWARAAPPWAMTLVPRLLPSVKTVFGWLRLRFSVRKNCSRRVVLEGKFTKTPKHIYLLAKNVLYFKWATNAPIK